MTLPHYSALAGAREQRRIDDHVAVHVRRRIGSRSGRIEWSKDNIARLVLLVGVGVVALGGLVMCRAADATTDPSTARGAANAYFAALQHGDEEAQAPLQCSDVPGQAGLEAVAEALRGEPGAAPTYELGPRYGNSGDYSFDFEVAGEVRGSISVEQVGNEQRYVVCDFFDVQVRRP